MPQLRTIEEFERLFRRLHAPLCEVVDSYVRSQDVAEEIVQDLFLVVWLKRDQMNRVESIDAYLYTAARNRAIQHLRRRLVWRRSRDEIARNQQELAAPQLADSALEHTDNLRALRAAIDRLAVRTRLALVLRLDHELSHSEIAVAMGISVKRVEKLLATARTRLREELGDRATPALDGRDPKSRR